jgi:hypothetical protein
MRRIILWIAAILITFAIGVGADRLWWHFLASPSTDEPAALDVVVPQREVVFVPAPAPPPPAPPKPNIILDYDGEYLSAAFYIMGSKPKEFADIESLSIYLSPGTDDYPAEIRVNTHQVNDDSSYDNAESTFVLVTNRRVFLRLQNWITRNSNIASTANSCAKIGM